MNTGILKLGWLVSRRKNSGWGRRVWEDGTQTTGLVESKSGTQAFS